MASRQNINIQINAAVESADAAQSLGQLRRSLIQIQELQGQIGDTSSEEFAKLQRASQQATSRLAQTREAVGDIQDRVRTLDGSPFERMSNSVGLLREGLMNLDLDKVKVAFEGLKASLLSNPIFLIAGAIAAAAAAIGAILGSLGLLKPLLDGIGKAFEVVKDKVGQLTDFLGLTANAEEKRIKAILDAAEKEKVVIADILARRKAAFELTRGLNEEQIKEIEKELGVRLSSARTAAQLEAQLAREAYDANAKILNQVRREIRDAEYDKREVSKETYDQLAVLVKQDHDLWRELDKAKATQLQETYTIQIELEKQLQGLKVENISNETTRRKAEAKLRYDEAIANLEQEKKNLDALGKTYVGYEELRKQITIKYNNEIAQINKDAREKSARERLNEFDKEQQLLLLKEKDGTIAYLELQKQGLQERINLLKQYQTELELSDTDILIEVEKTNDKIAELDLAYYQNDIKQWEENWNLKLRREEEGSSRRLELEQQYLQDRLVLYRNNYKSFGMSDEEFATLEVETGRSLLRVQKSLQEKFNFDTGTLVTETNVQQLVFKLREQLNKPEMFKPYEDFVAKLANIGQAQFPKLDFLQYLYPKESMNELSLRQDEISQETIFTLRKLSEEFFKQEAAKLQLQLSNLKIYGELSKKELEQSFSIADQRANYDDLIKASEEYYAKLYEIQEISGNQRVYQTAAEYAKYAAMEEADLLERLKAENLTAEKKNEILVAYAQSRLEQDRINNEAILALKEENETLLTEIEKKAADERIAIKGREERMKTDLAKQGLGAIANLAKIFFIAQKAQARGNAEEEKKIAKQQFDTEKAFNVGMAVINGIQSILAITTVPDFTLGIANGIRIAAQVALNAASIAGILSQQFDGGGTTTTPSTSTPSMGVVGGGAAAPAVPVGGGFDAGQFYGLGGMQLAGFASGSQRVYVLETDITRVQRNVNVIESRAQLQ